MNITLAEFLSLFSEWDKFTVICSTTEGSTVTLEINYNCYKYRVYDPGFMNFAIRSISKGPKGTIIILN